jgi:hypothetical protein
MDASDATNNNRREKRAMMKKTRAEKRDERETILPHVRLLLPLHRCMIPCIPALQLVLLYLSTGFTLTDSFL